MSTVYVVDYEMEAAGVVRNITGYPGYRVLGPVRK